MFKFLKKIMNNQKPILTNENNSIHRILKTDIKKTLNHNEDEIIFGCGCFWGAEKCFWKLPGVVTTSVGYAGGSKSNPNYYEVCSGLTGHSEVVRVVWDKTKIDIILLDDTIDISCSHISWESFLDKCNNAESFDFKLRLSNVPI